MLGEGEQGCEKHHCASHKLLCTAVMTFKNNVRTQCTIRKIIGWNVFRFNIVYVIIYYIYFTSAHCGLTVPFVHFLYSSAQVHWHKYKSLLFVWGGGGRIDIIEFKCNTSITWNRTYLYRCSISPVNTLCVLLYLIEIFYVLLITTKGWAKCSLWLLSIHKNAFIYPRLG